MAFFEELGKQLTGAAQAVGKRAIEAAEIGRLNGRLGDVREQIDELFAQIGKAYYATRDAQGRHEAADRLCVQIDELNGQAEELSHSIDKIKRQRRCLSCGGVQPVESRFCASCGARLPEDAPVLEPEPDEAQEPPEAAPEAPEQPVAQAFEKGEVNVEINWPKAQEAPEGTHEAQPEDEARPEDEG
ncbi:hypothetical protein ACH6CV_00590 [Bacillota bacterium Meth-B3]|nr:hypothetical protein [Christensenellaceae bacterium]MEA5066157.1 hypothetical protein [Eubacteriales bacterium]